MTGADENAFRLLKQLEHLLESDALIDEVGFIHPSQFAALNDSTVDSHGLFVEEEADTLAFDVNALKHGNTVLWSRDHKLAISTQALLPLYTAAKHAFMIALEQYKGIIGLPKEIDNISIPRNSFENEVMRHSKALLLLSYDFGTAWNIRKLVAKEKQHLSLFMDELRLSALILSYSPKSEHAWSHRRWVIKAIDGKHPNVQDIVQRESELVKKIAEKSKMNYRAWNHRCWLITYMTSEQVINELNKSRKWAELHIADSSCFHYRQLLLRKMLEHSCADRGSALPLDLIPKVYDVWMEEVSWNKLLIKRYIGREALWLHRRFLSQFGFSHFCTIVEGDVKAYMDSFIDGELELLHDCLTKSDNEFEDGDAQRVHAASYILWVSKESLHFEVINSRDKLRDLEDLISMLNKLCPEKTRLWGDLFGV